MKKSVISFAIASCFVFGASLAQAQAISAPKPAFTAEKRPRLQGKAWTPHGIAANSMSVLSERDAPGFSHAPGKLINHSQAQDFKIDPGYKNDDGQRMQISG